MTDRHVVRRAGLLACLALLLAAPHAAASVAPATVLAGIPAAAVAGDPVPSVVTFRGRVLDADRRPVEGARVVVVPVDRLPAGQSEADVRRTLLSRYGIEVGGGLGPVAGQVWRIGCMGHTARPANVTTLLAALDEILAS